MQNITSEFLNAIRSGNTAAFEHLYEQYKDKIYALALSTLKNTQDAEDATQQTFIAVYNKLNMLRDDNAFNTWIQRIAINECNAILRKRKGELSIDDETGGALVERIEDDMLLPQEYIERDDLSRRLQEIIDDLPTVQRQALVLQMYHNLSMAEIAQIMNCSENTVKSRIRYAKATIKTEIEERERKSGEKFYGAVFLPFGTIYTRLVQSNAMSPAAAARIWSAINSYIASLAYAGAGVSGAAVAAKGGMTLGLKVAIGVIAGVVVLCSVLVATILLFPSLFRGNHDAAEPGANIEPTAVTATQAPTEKATEATVEEPTEAPEEDFSDVYSSYLDLLQNKETSINNYGTVIKNSDPDVVAFADLTGDGTPEMIYLSADNLQGSGSNQYGFGSMDIVTYNEDTGSTENLYHDDQWYVNAAAGGLSCLFTTDSGTYQCMKNSDEKDMVNYYQLSYQGGQFERTDAANNRDVGYAYPYTVSDALGTEVNKVLLSSLKEDVLGISDSAPDEGMTYDEAIAYLNGHITATAADDEPEEQEEQALSESEILETVAGQYSEMAGTSIVGLTISPDGSAELSITGRMNPEQKTDSGTLSQFSDEGNGIYSFAITYDNGLFSDSTLTYYPKGTSLSVLSDQEISNMQAAGLSQSGSMDRDIIFSSSNDVLARND